VAIVGALYVAVALYYYFRIVRIMFLVEEGAPSTPAPTRSLGFQSALLITGVLTLAIGIYPEPFLRFARILPGGNGVTSIAPAVRTASGGQ
jgi:NADH-quinone oxidoreductase subunit N